MNPASDGIVVNEKNLHCRSVPTARIYGPDVPNILGIFPNGPITGKLAHSGHIQNRLGTPRGVINESLRNLVLSGNIGSKVCEMKVVITLLEQSAANWIEDARIFRGKGIRS